MPRLRIAMVAGESSGDLLGASLLTSLRARCDTLEVEGIGGPHMTAQGLTSLFPMERLSVMGLVEPLKRLPELLRIRRDLLRHFRQNPPDLFLGIDSPDFNLTLERRLRESGIPTAHLVSPSVWAWRAGRIRKIRRAVDLMLCLFPFETAVYRRHGVPVCYVGHPMADEISPQSGGGPERGQLGLGEGPLVALLPGSRESEVRLLGPRFLQAARLLRQEAPQLGFAMPAANEARRRQLQEMLADYPDLPLTLMAGQSRELMSTADAVLAASGTATLEAALTGCPMVVAYRMGTLSWLVLSKMINTPYAALPNILAGRELVPELIQGNATPAAMVAGLQPLLSPGPARAGQLRGFEELHRELRRGAAQSAASALLELVETRRQGIGRPVAD